MAKLVTRSDPFADRESCQASPRVFFGHPKGRVKWKVCADYLDGQYFKQKHSPKPWIRLCESADVFEDAIRGFAEPHPRLN
jgi:hypothetical protein